MLSDNAALAQTSFGQRDVRVTPLQAAMLSAAVANNGTLMQPYLVKSELRPEPVGAQHDRPEAAEPGDRPDLDQELIKMMEGVVTSPEGTGGPANVTEFGHSVKIGGKTGTADVGQTSASNDKPDAWFTGFALVKGNAEDRGRRDHGERRRRRQRDHGRAGGRPGRQEGHRGLSQVDQHSQGMTEHEQ